jgi:hypothetical protein
MIRNKLSALIVLALSCGLGACSGLKNGGNGFGGGNGGGGNGGGGGTSATVTVTLFDTPPAGVSFVNLNMAIASMALTPTTGSDTTLFSTANTFELTRLQSDSSLVGTFTVPAGTYTTLKMFVTSSPFGVWSNNSGSTILGCNTGSICNFAGSAPGQLSIDLTKVAGMTQGLTVSAGQNAALGVEINLNTALTSTNGLSLDLTQSGAVTAVSLPRTGQASGTVDTIEDFLGVVQSVSGSTVAVKNGAGQTLTGTTSAQTTAESFSGSSACGGNATLGCLATGQTVSIDGTVSTGGTFNITNVDFLDTPATDEVEGTIFLTSTPGSFMLVVSDKVQTSTDATLTPVGSGSVVNVIMPQNQTVTFAIDSGTLPISNPVGFASAADILNGQRIMAHVASVSQGSLVAITPDRLLLRFSRFTGTVQTVAPPSFTISALQSFFPPFQVPPQVQTFTPGTLFDNVTDVSSLSVGDSVSVRGLFLDATPNFIAAKVRKH